MLVTMLALRMMQVSWMRYFCVPSYSQFILTAYCSQVDAFLQAHDSGLTEADKEVAKELLTASPMK